MNEQRGIFPSTCHSALAAVRGGSAVARARALEVVVRGYWRPLYKLTRLRWGKPPDESEELTQGFFAHLLEKGTLEQYDPHRARFRTFLRVCFERFVVGEHQRDTAAKRGGSATVVSLDFDLAERELALIEQPPAERLDEYFQAETARCLFAAALSALRTQHGGGGKAMQLALFERVALVADDEERPSYAAVAAELGISVHDVNNGLAWARRELRRLVLDELRAVTGSEEEFRDEARTLLGIELG